jgi:hypothetical protein
MTETSSSPRDAAHQAIGAYFCEFSRVEHELGESVKVAYGLQNNEASDAIVAALWDFARKANLVWAASKGAKNADGSDASEEWKDKVETIIKRVLGYNWNDRVPLAHSLLEPNDDGSVTLVRHKVEEGKVKGREGGITWSRHDFNDKIQRLNSLAAELKLLNAELQTFTYTIRNLGWASSNAFLPQMPPPAALYLNMQQWPRRPSAPDDSP